VKSKHIPRLITAAVVIPALVWIVGWGGAGIFSWLIFIVAALSLLEYYGMAFPARPKEQALGILSGLLVAAGILIHDVSGFAPWLAGAIVLLFSIHLFFGGGLEERYRNLAWTVVGTLYIGYLIPHAALLYRLPDGPRWIFFVLIVVMIGDTAAYFVGTSLGKRKLYTEVSPGKTVEGAIGSTAATLVAGIVAGNFFLPSYPWQEILGISLALSVLGQVGDLFESWIKRVFAVKDSGAMLPGHGGLLDRMDSLIFPLVFVTYYLRTLHP
jgi:phosphatidate cytidylyltransferase